MMLWWCIILWRLRSSVGVMHYFLVYKENIGLTFSTQDFQFIYRHLSCSRVERKVWGAETSLFISLLVWMAFIAGKKYHFGGFVINKSKKLMLHWNTKPVIKILFLIEIYTSSESWINNISIDVGFAMIGQYLKILNLRVQKNLNIEKIIFKFVQMKFLAMHITNQ